MFFFPTITKFRPTTESEKKGKIQTATLQAL